VYDAAGKAYILPHIIGHAKDRKIASYLESLLPRMLDPVPAARPSFSELLADLARFEEMNRK